MRGAGSDDERAVGVDPGNASREVGPVRVVVSGAETGGRFAVVETRERRGGEPPLHVHTREDEFVYVLEGHMTIHRGEERLDCPAGTGVLLPRGCEHTFALESAEARLLALLLPAGAEGLYAELGRPTNPGGEDPQRVSPDLERLVTIAARCGVAITGSPPANHGEARG